MSRSGCERLMDIVDRIDCATSAEARLTSAEADDDRPLVQIAFDAVLYDLVVIGEAIKALPEDWTSAHPEVPWSDAARMRDLLAHQYFRIRADVVRATLDRPLAELRRACEELLIAHCR